MSIYSCNISNVSRAKGSSSCASLSYISAETVREDRTQNVYQYGRGERVILVETRLPEGAPERYQDPTVLFNEIESYEKAANARTAKKIMVALPIEFDLLKQKEVLEEYIHDNLTKEGYASTYAIHADKENKNPHAHILIVNRAINNNGKWSTKSKKTYALDDDGQRVPIIDPNTGVQKLGKRNEKLWKRVDVQVNLLDQKEMLEQLREQWAVVCNKSLSPENQIDHRSLKEQGKEDIEPTIHEGYVARKIEKNGGISTICEENRQIKQRNSLINEILNLFKNLLQLRSKESEKQIQPASLTKTDEPKKKKQSTKAAQPQKPVLQPKKILVDLAKEINQAIQEVIQPAPTKTRKTTTKQATWAYKKVYNNLDLTQFDQTMKRYGIDYTLDNERDRIYVKSQDVDTFTQAFKEFSDTQVQIRERPRTAIMEKLQAKPQEQTKQRQAPQKQKEMER